MNNPQPTKMRYPDDVDGVRAMLMDDGTSLVPIAIKADPDVRGCYRVDCDEGETLIAYVGDHPFAPDFEVCEEDPKLTTYRRACELLAESGYEADFRGAYSGRAMYGRTVPAIVCDASGPIIGWAIATAYTALYCDDDPQDLLDASRAMMPTRMDSMGMSTIHY